MDRQSVIKPEDITYDDLDEVWFSESDNHPQEDSVIAQEIWEQIHEEHGNERRID